MQGRLGRVVGCGGCDGEHLRVHSNFCWRARQQLGIEHVRNAQVNVITAVRRTSKYEASIQTRRSFSLFSPSFYQAVYLLNTTVYNQRMKPSIPYRQRPSDEPSQSTVTSDQLLLGILYHDPLAMLLKSPLTRRDRAVMSRECHLDKWETRTVFPSSCQHRPFAITTMTGPPGVSRSPHDRVLSRLESRRAWQWTDSVC